MLPFLRLCAAALAAAAVLAAPAAAQAPVPTPLAPADGATVADRHAGHLHRARAGRARRPHRALARGGRRVRRHRRGRRAPRRDADALRPDARAVHGARGARRRRVVLAGRQPGRLQRGPGVAHHGHRVGRDARRRRPRPASRRPTRRSPAVTLPKLSRAPIPSRIGKTNHALLVLALGEGSPSVTRSRFVTLVRNSARRWRLDARGPVKRVPRLGDAHNDVGFAAALVSEGALGTTTLLRQNYVRVRRVCAAGGCRTTRTPVGSRVVERDLALLPDVPWAQGPAHPTGEEYDLETVILHELGHWAGNLRHTPVGCHDTPMVKGLGPGEWWRSSSDWQYDACDAAAAPAPRARSTSRRPPRRGRSSPSASSSAPSSSVRRAGHRVRPVHGRREEGHARSSRRSRPRTSRTGPTTSASTRPSAGARATTPTTRGRSASSGPRASSTTPTARSRSTASRSMTPRR